MILNCQVKLAVERAVCLICACWLADHGLSFRCWQHITLSNMTCVNLCDTDLWAMGWLQTFELLLYLFHNQPSAAACGRWWWRRWFATLSSPPTSTWVVCSSSQSWCPCHFRCCPKRSEQTSVVGFSLWQILHCTSVCVICLLETGEHELRMVELISANFRGHLSLNIVWFPCLKKKKGGGWWYRLQMWYESIKQLFCQWTLSDFPVWKKKGK